MAKHQVGQAKFQVPGGQATPAPPVGTSLGKFGINLGQFVQQFNDRTRPLSGKVVGCVITVYADRSFDFEVKSPPSAVLIKEAAGIEKGSSVPNKDKVATITKDQVESIAKEKVKELTGHSVEAMVRTIAGTARSMGVVVEGMD